MLTMTAAGQKPGWLRSLLFGHREPSRERQAVADSHEAIEKAVARLDDVSDKFGAEIRKMQSPKKKRKRGT